MKIPQNQETFQLLAQKHKNTTDGSRKLLYAKHLTIREARWVKHPSMDRPYCLWRKSGAMVAVIMAGISRWLGSTIFFPSLFQGIE